MRWDELKIDADPTLPGYQDAVVRRFDAPEALDTRFYEVRAKSALNRVPKASQMPFGWTVNPYRGCSHACTYCLAGDTPILMGDGSAQPLAEVVPGDVVYGTERVGRYRRYVRTEVRDHWSSIKRAYRVCLADGTELVASGDHRFLTERGWMHVTGAGSGPLCRPHLTTGNELRGTGGFAAPVEKSADYRRGYLCGMVRGDAHLGEYVYTRADRGESRVHRFRLALADGEALERAAAYLAEEGVATREFASSAGSTYHRPIAAIRTSRRADCELIDRLIRWPLSPPPEWSAGFLAGIFDAEGSAGAGGNALRISNTDPAILGWTRASFERFGFSVREGWGEGRGRLGCIRLLGGLRERLRFFHLCDPAIARKREMEGLALKSDADLRVVALEDLGEARRLYDITTGSGDFIANGVVSHNCFARPTHEYLDLNAGRDFEREIVVKVNAPEVLRAQLSKPSWTREHVALGTNTDPYQWVEGRYRLMPGIWEALRDTDTPCSILTKSPLLLRDIDLLAELAERVGLHANLSIPTIDEKAWRATEPHTPNPRARIEAVAELNRAGIPTGVLIAPLMPGINDAPEQVEEILELCAEAGAVDVGGICLHLRGSVKELFMDWLRSQRPDLVPRYERLYSGGAYAPPEERRRIADLLSSRTPPGVRPGVAFRRIAERNEQRRREREEELAAEARRREEAQTSLF